MNNKELNRYLSSPSTTLHPLKFDILISTQIKIKLLSFCCILFFDNSLTPGWKQILNKKSSPIKWSMGPCYLAL